MRIVPILAVLIAITPLGYTADAAGAGDPAVELPRLEVEAQRPYLYAEVSGVRILSLADRRITLDFAEAASDNIELFLQVLPEECRPIGGITCSVILNSPSFERILDARFGGRRFTVPALWKVTVNESGDIPVVMYREPDALGVEQPLPDFDFPTPGLPLEPPASWPVAASWASNVAAEYARRYFALHPELPDWFRIGVEYAGLRQGYLRGELVSCSSVPVPAKEGRVDSKQLRLWPLAQFFQLADRQIALPHLVRIAPDDSEARAGYRFQSTLFLYWGLLDGKVEHRDRFKRFVRAACERPINEELFRTCFGYDYTEADRRLTRFANEVLHRGGHIDGTKLQFLLPAQQSRRTRPNVELRQATRDEVIRLIGEADLWSTLRNESTIRVAGSTLGNNRALTNRGYWRIPADPLTPFQFEMFASAQRVISRAVGSNDAQLKALLGFYELRLGNVAEGERWLREAVAAKVQRPRVYVDLALLSLDAALTHPQGANGRLSREQVAPILGLLREGLRQFPEMKLAYVLLAFTWESSTETPGPEELSALLGAVRRYPEELDMMGAVALLYERAGRPQQALDLARLVTAMAPTWHDSRRQVAPLVQAHEGRN